MSCRKIHSATARIQIKNIFLLLLEADGLIFVVIALGRSISLAIRLGEAATPASSISGSSHTKSRIKMEICGTQSSSVQAAFGII